MNKTNQIKLNKLYFYQQLSYFDASKRGFMFSENLVTQMAAYFLRKETHPMKYIKLLKLLYLAEREAMAKWGQSISGDRFVSMPQGPVLSQTYDLIKGSSSDSGSIWEVTIKGEANYKVAVESDLDEDFFDELSKAETNLLDDIYKKFGGFTGFELVTYTHDHCQEWSDPNGSSYPIKPKAILEAMGKTETQICEMLIHVSEETALTHLKNSLR
ncbi:MAG: SocA family protein [Paraglaciecola sp.]|nr:SocA family protein [Paraglaciecola sp.]